MKKLTSASGETIIETLVSILVITVIFLCLSTAIVTAARVNATVRNADTAFRYSEATAKGSKTVSVTKNGDASPMENFPVTDYATKNGYHYYQNQGG